MCFPHLRHRKECGQVLVTSLTNIPALLTPVLLRRSCFCVTTNIYCLSFPCNLHSILPALSAIDVRTCTLNYDARHFHSNLHRVQKWIKKQDAEKAKKQAEQSAKDPGTLLFLLRFLFFFFHSHLSLLVVFLSFLRTSPRLSPLSSFPSRCPLLCRHCSRETWTVGFVEWSVKTMWLPLLSSPSSCGKWAPRSTWHLLGVSVTGSCRMASLLIIRAQCSDTFHFAGRRETRTFSDGIKMRGVRTKTICRDDVP